MSAIMDFLSSTKASNSGTSRTTTSGATAGATSNEGRSSNWAGAREALEALSYQTQNISMAVPGPFVVLQGMPGDGMANTIDCMPDIIEEEDDADGNINVHGRSRREGQRGATEAPTAIAADAARAGGSGSGDADGDDDITASAASSAISIPSDLPNEIPNLSSASVNSSHTTPSGLGSLQSNEILHDNENLMASHEGSDDELVCMADSMTSDISYLDVINADIGNSASASALLASQIGTPRLSNVAPNHTFQNRTQIDRGLHLPLPASAVSVAAMGMGYNTFLPAPVSRQPIDSNNNTTTNYNATKSGSNRRQTRTRHANAHAHASINPVQLTDSFVMVDDSSNNENYSITENAEMESSRHEHGHDEASNNGSVLFSTQSSSIDIGNKTSCSNNPRYTNISPSDKVAIQQWKVKCREEEKYRRNEIIMEIKHSQSSANIAESLISRNQWWRTKNGCLAVFNSLPMLAKGTGPNGSGSRIANKSIPGTTVVQTNSGNDIVTGQVIGELTPGTTIMASELHCLDESLIPNSTINLNHKNIEKYQILKIESPTIGYVVYSANGYSYLGPGLPSYYVEPEVWTWRVTCPIGCYVRQGLELTSVHTDTIPYGTFMRVTQKTVNSMGLSRLQVESMTSNNSESKTDRDVSYARLNSTGPRNRTSAIATSTTQLLEHVESEGNINQKISGWVSEALNPLSGQRGNILQPVPFPVPALYRVTLADGAVIRSGIELSSPQIGHATCGTVLTIVGRAYSEHPVDRCLERLKLAGSGGWISVRLNKTPPRDCLVVEMIGIDGTFDPNEAGLYHIQKQRQVINECNSNIATQSSFDTQNMQNLRRSLANLSSTISSIPDEDEGEQGGHLENSGELSSITSTAVPTLYRSGVATGASIESQSTKDCGSKALREEHCLICLTEKRTATIVHGGTGHIACCLTCSRILKARGDKCPVCRLPIDSIIQQFWA